MTKEILNFHASQSQHAGLMDTRLNDILYEKYHPHMTTQERIDHLDNMTTETKTKTPKNPTPKTPRKQKATTLLSFF